jgi:hypothetical protein
MSTTNKKLSRTHQIEYQVPIPELPSLIARCSDDDFRPPVRRGLPTATEPLWNTTGSPSAGHRYRQRLQLKQLKLGRHSYEKKEVTSFIFLGVTLVRLLALSRKSSQKSQPLLPAYTATLSRVRRRGGARVHTPAEPERWADDGAGIFRARRWGQSAGCLGLRRTKGDGARRHGWGRDYELLAPKF